MAAREAARCPHVPDSPSPVMPASVSISTKRNWPIETGVTAVIFMGILIEEASQPAPA